MISFVVLGAGICFFIAFYLSFDFWEQKYWGKIIETRDETHAAYEDIFRLKSKEEVLREMLIYAFIPTAVILLVTWPHIILSIPVGLVVFIKATRLPLILIHKFHKKKRVEKFSVQMVDALTLMGNGLRSGLNVPQTIQIVVNEMPAPVSQEFGLVLNENRLGLTLEKAFDNLARRIDTEDVNMFTTSVNILRETGGNIAETFETIVSTIRDRMKLQSKIQAMTAQGMMSAIIIGCLPWAMGIMMYAIDPNMMRPLFTTIWGFLLLFAIICLEAVGFYVILKIIKIRV